jgi:protein-L-isoaspartate(D-aspartate) O-methyltransferase
MDEGAGGRTIEERAALLLQLRRVGVRDLAVMRAFEATPRESFTPHRFRDLAARNIALPIGCGQTLPAPADLARRVEALAVEPQHRVLEVGTGSGYGAAVLSRLARQVVSIERFETLVEEARRRLAEFGVGNVESIFGDGLAAGAAPGPFDRIVLHMSFRSAPPAGLMELLAPGGVAVFGRIEEEAEEGGRRSERLRRLRRDGGALRSETDLGPCRLGPALQGVALAL